MSARWSVDKKDFSSAIRHFLFPVLGFGLVGGVEALKSGEFDPSKIAAAVGAGVLAGALRLAQRLAQDFAPPSQERVP